jgi:hypothetical protein
MSDARKPQPQPYSFATKDGHAFSGVDGRLHSVNDQPAVVYTDGTKWWYKQGQIHRDGGPAVVHPNGVEEWWQNNKRHRTGGPAVIYPDTAEIIPELRGVKQHWDSGNMFQEELPPAVRAYRAEVAALQKKHGFRA